MIWPGEGQESKPVTRMRAARDLVAESAKQGRINLSRWIETGDAQGARLAAISFAEAVEIAP
ncbi:MAG: hypothetical protein QOH47_3155 [Sphingomonadales bacterium]|nr:hypothetical protein [Sphingomonadales bacterium]